MAESVFVYGTLRRGQVNFEIARRSGLVAAEPAQAFGLDLFHLEPEGYPAAVPGSGRVVGELLLLAWGLEQLDLLEGLAERPAPYRRARWPLGSTTRLGSSAWIYLFNDGGRLGRPGAARVESGDWLRR